MGEIELTDEWVEPEVTETTAARPCALVLDDSGILQRLVPTLIRLGVEALHAFSLREALQVATQSGGAVQALVVSPQCDPERLELLLARLRGEAATAPTPLVVGPRCDPSRRVVLRALGIRRALFEPYDEAEIRFAVIQAILDGGRELRIEPRVPVDLAAVCHRGSVRHIARVSDLSVGGAFVATRTPPPLESLVKLEIELPGVAIEPRARVAHVREAENPDRPYLPMGFGVAFEALDTRMEAPLRDYLSTRLARFTL